MESAANRLQKEAKGYLDSLRGRPGCRHTIRKHERSDNGRTAMTASQMRIAETIDAFYGDAGANDGVSRSYKQAVEDLDAETIKALDGPFRYTLFKCQCTGEEEKLTLYSLRKDKQSWNQSHASVPTSPTSTNVSLLPLEPNPTIPPAPAPNHPHILTNHTTPGIKKRNHKLLDYDATRAKVKKLVEKPDKDPTKLPRAERDSDLAKTAYEALNDQLFSELPQLIDLRVPYLDPSFEALVKIQLRFCAEAYSRMAQVQQFLDADTREQYAQGHLDSRVEQVLGEIRELSIAGTV